MSRKSGSRPHVNTAALHCGETTGQRVKHFAHAFTLLDEHDKQMIDLVCADLMQVPGIGTGGALELAGALGEWLARNPWYQRRPAPCPD